MNKIEEIKKIMDEDDEEFRKIMKDADNKYITIEEATKRFNKLNELFRLKVGHVLNNNEESE